MRTPRNISLAILTAFSIFISSVSWAVTFIGEAKDEKGTVVYYEIQEITFDDEGYTKEVKTTYEDASRKKFASLRSDFTKSKLVPDSIFEDERFGRTEKVFYDVAQKYVKISVSEPGKKISEEKKLSYDAAMVSGQGFHNLIIQNFDASTYAEKGIKFIVAPKLDFFKFKIRPVLSRESQRSKFALSADSFLLKMFVSKIEVTYNSINKRLVEFKGLSNLDDPKRNSQIVTITYTYPNGDK